MVCPECSGTDLRVLDINKPYLTKSGLELVGWWAEDCFIVRRRGCKTCKHSWRTIEISIDDLRDALCERGTVLRDKAQRAAEYIQKALVDLGSIE